MVPWSALDPDRLKRLLAKSELAREPAREACGRRQISVFGTGGSE